MATTTEKATATEWLALNYPSLIAIAALLILVTGIFIKGGHAPYSALLGTLSLSQPFAILASAGFISYVHIKRIARRDSGWYGSVVFFIAVVGIISAGLGMGEGSVQYQYLAKILHATPWVATMSANAFTVVLLFARALRPKNLPFLYMAVLAVFALLATTPLGEAIWLPSYHIGLWIQGSVNVVGNNLTWMLIHLAEVALIIRIFTFREKLRVA